MSNVRIEFGDTNISGLTDALGLAYFKIPPGLARVRAIKAGYSIRQESFIVGLADALDVTIAMQKNETSQKLDPVSIRATRLPEYLHDFEIRRNLGLGHFLGEAQLDSTKHEMLADVVARKFMGLRAEWTLDRMGVKLMSTRGYVRFGGSTRCAARVYVDEIPIDAMDLASLQSGDIAGIEYYSNAPPVRYAPAGTLCGAVVIWTKR